MQWDLEEKLRTGRSNSELALIYKESLGNTLGIAQSLGLFDLDALRKDAVSSKSTTIENFQLVAEIFHGHFKKYLERMYRGTREIDETIYGDQLSFLCVQAALVPRLDRFSSQVGLPRYCAGRRVKSVFDKLEMSLDFDELSKSKFPRRVCRVYDFNRRSRIFGLAKGAADQ